MSEPRCEKHEDFPAPVCGCVECFVVLRAENARLKDDWNLAEPTVKELRELKLENERLMKVIAGSVNLRNHETIVASLKADNERLTKLLQPCRWCGAEKGHTSGCYELMLNKLQAQVTALTRDFGIQREYWNECEHKLAAMTQEKEGVLKQWGLEVYELQRQLAERQQQVADLTRGTRVATPPSA